MLQQVPYAAVLFFHDLFTVTWVGGLLVVGWIVAPAARKALGTGEPLRRFMQALETRLTRAVYISMAGLILTGILLARQAPQFRGLFNVSNPYGAVLAVKHALTLAMVAVALLRSLVLRRAAPRVRQGLFLANMALGPAVLVLSGLGAALSRAA